MKKTIGILMILIQLIGCAKTPTTEIKTDTIIDTHITEEPAGETIFTLRNGVFLLLGALAIYCIYQCWSADPMFEKRKTEKRLRDPHITTETTQRLQQRIKDEPPKSPLYPPPRRDASTRRSQRDAEKATAQLKARIGDGIILLLTQKEFEQYLPRIWTAIRHEPEMPQAWMPDLKDAPEGLIERVLALKYIMGNRNIFESANIASSVEIAHLFSLVRADYSDFLSHRIDTHENQLETMERLLKEQEDKPESYIRTLKEQIPFHTVRLDQALAKNQDGVVAAQEHAKRLVFDLACFAFYYERRPFIIDSDELPF